MIRSNRVRIVFILVVFLGLFVCNQDKQTNEDKQLREDILAAYKSGGERGLLDFVKKKKDKISNKFILDFAKAGVKERKEEWLKVCKIMAKMKKDKKIIADVLYNTGKYFRIISDNKKAADYFDQAYGIYFELYDTSGKGTMYSHKGYSWDYLITSGTPWEDDMMLKAEDCYCKEIVRESLGPGNVKEIFTVATGVNPRALEKFEEVLSLYEKGRPPLDQGYLYMSKGDDYFLIGENSRALEMYEKALPFYEKASSPEGQGEVYYQKGNIYSSIYEFSKALKMYDKALVFYEKAGASNDFYERGVSINQGNIYLDKGNIYSSIGKNSRAFEMYDKALLFYKKASLPIGQSNVYWSKGIIYSGIGDYSRAIEMFDKALPFYEGFPLALGDLYLYKGEVYFGIGENSKALKMCDKALLSYNKWGEIESESKSYALHAKATILVRLGKKGKALDLFEEGIANLEKVRTKTLFSEMKKTLMEKNYDLYQYTVLFMLENKYYDKGFKYVESMKARVFLDRMAEGLVKLDKGLKPELKQKRDNLVKKLSLLSKEMQKIDWNKEKKKFRELKEQYLKTEREFGRLLVKIRLENPLYASVRYPKPVSLPELQKKILKKGEILVRFFISPDKPYVFLISKQSFEVVSLEVKAEKIKSYVNRWLLAVKSNDTRELEMYGKLLYRGLFKPIETKLKGVREIIIIPDNHLEQIPFESFIIDEEKSGRPIFLLEKYRVKYMQSASILSILRKHYRRDRETKKFIAFGDPVYDYENFKQGKQKQGNTPTAQPIEDEIKQVLRGRYDRAGGTWKRLLNSGEEIQSIARIFEKQSLKSISLLREQAAEEKAKAANMKDFDYIHFSCHGLLNDDFQSLVLSQLPPEKSPEDGYFTLNEVMNCDYNAKLVVLSACQTVSGKMYKGEGVTGLTRAVMYAGTPAVIANLWKVDDAATKELMIRFYKNMLEKNLDKTEALRQAKLELLKSEKYSSPLFWSGFVLYGE